MRTWLAAYRAQRDRSRGVTDGLPHGARRPAAAEHDRRWSQKKSDFHPQGTALTGGVQQAAAERSVPIRIRYLKAVWC
jgi:hypothetical protein